MTERPLTAEEAERTAVMFKALGDPVRLRLFSAIASHEAGEACVCDISDVGVSAPIAGVANAAGECSLLLRLGLEVEGEAGAAAWAGGGVEGAVVGVGDPGGDGEAEAAGA
ncbi:hypothetical protein RIU97_33315 [Streptomyces sp. 147326]